MILVPFSGVGALNMPMVPVMHLSAESMSFTSLCRLRIDPDASSRIPAFFFLGSTSFSGVGFWNRHVSSLLKAYTQLRWKLTSPNMIGKSDNLRKVGCVKCAHVRAQNMRAFWV